MDMFNILLRVAVAAAVVLALLWVFEKIFGG